MKLGMEIGFLQWEAVIEDGFDQGALFLVFAQLFDLALIQLFPSDRVY